MFIAVRETKCMSAPRIWAGHEALKHLRATSSLSFPSFDPHEGHVSGLQSGALEAALLSESTLTT
jgi:hypothetical protein